MRSVAGALAQCRGYVALTGPLSVATRSVTARHYEFKDSTGVVLTARRRHAIEVSVVGLHQAVRNLLPGGSRHRMKDGLLTLRFDLEDDRTVGAVEIPIAAQDQRSG